MLSDASSGLNSAAGRIRSSTVMCGDPPVVKLITALVWFLSDSRIGTKWSGFCEGRPSCGSRACMWTTAAPASAAPIAASAISDAETGRYFDIEGVWLAPVTAQVMMTLRGMSTLFCVGTGRVVRGRTALPNRGRGTRRRWAGYRVIAVELDAVLD